MEFGLQRAVSRPSRYRRGITAWDNRVRKISRRWRTIALPRFDPHTNSRSKESRGLRLAGGGQRLLRSRARVGGRSRPPANRGERAMGEHTHLPSPEGGRGVFGDRSVRTSDGGEPSERRRSRRRRRSREDAFPSGVRVGVAFLLHARPGRRCRLLDRRSPS